MLTADISSMVEERFDRCGQRHVRVAVWPCKPGPPSRPIPTARWTPLQKTAAERVAKRNLAGIGEGSESGRAIAGQMGDYALHCFVAMNGAERAGLGLS